MLQKPKFLAPSINIYGKSVIDLNDTKIPFSCIVDGNEAITKWQIEIYSLETNNLVFNSGERELDEPFYPINNKNQNVMFLQDLKELFDEPYSNNSTIYYKIDATNTEYKSTRTYYYKADDNKYTGTGSGWNIVSQSLYYKTFINRQGAFYWHITMWGESGTIVTSCDEVFYANSKPITEILYSDDDNTYNVLTDEEALEKRTIYFKANYTQAENISLKRYGWRITDKLNDVALIDTISHNQVYGVVGDISCVCNGFVNDTEYNIELYIETQNGFFNILQSIDFKIYYNTEYVGGDIDIEADNNISGVVINFGDIITIEGVVSGENVSYVDHYPIQNNSVSVDIPKNSRVIFSREVEIQEDASIVLSCQFDKTKDITLFEMEGKSDTTGLSIFKRLSYSSTSRRLQYVTSDDFYYSDSLSETTSAICWYIIILKPDGMTVAECKIDESTLKYPSNDLYPSSNQQTFPITYPQHGEWEETRNQS